MQTFCAASSSPPMSIIFLITKDQRRGANSRRVLRRSEGPDRCPLAGGGGGGGSRFQGLLPATTMTRALVVCLHRRRTGAKRRLLWVESDYRIVQVLTKWSWSSQNKTYDHSLTGLVPGRSFKGSFICKTQVYFLYDNLGDSVTRIVVKCVKYFFLIS